MTKMDFDFLHDIKGFMADEEAVRLHELALLPLPWARFWKSDPIAGFPRR
jgi:hypothetical protein